MKMGGEPPLHWEPPDDYGNKNSKEIKPKKIECITYIIR